MEFYNKHYILLDGESRIIDGWSDGPLAGKDTEDAICINEQGGYQFRLFPDGEENPALIDETGAHLWKYAGEVKPATEAEKEAERASFPQPEPGEEERLRQRVTELEEALELLLSGEVA